MTIRNRVDDRRDSSIVLDLQVRKEEVSCRRQPEARSDPLLEVERIKLVWMQREDRRRGGMAQRVLQTSFGHISINSSLILTVLTAPKSP